jgi:hypothetical protein
MRRVRPEPDIPELRAWRLREAIYIRDGNDNLIKGCRFITTTWE